MSKKHKKKKRITGEDTCSGFNDNPFAKALGLQPLPSQKAIAKTDDQEFDWTAASKIVLRRERKGRGGKTVTLVQGMKGITQDQAEAVAKKLKKALGTGVSVEDLECVVQGDQTERLKPIIEAWGASKIVTSG